MIFVRVDNVSRTAPQRINEPLAADHPLVADETACPGCEEAFAEGDITTFVVIGPGTDIEAQVRQMNGGYYDAVAIAAHAKCVHGEVPS